MANDAAQAISEQRSAAEIDLVTLEVLRNQLDAAAWEMHETLMRSAYSILLKEGADCATALFDIHGEQIAQSVAIPSMLGMLIPAVNRIIECFPPEQMGDGDIYVMNDPYEGGTHLPDFILVSPVVVDGNVVALSAVIAHHVEVGGKTPGSLPIDAVDIFQEGLRFSPVPLKRSGQWNETFFVFLEKNSRLPDVVIRDLRAMMAALRVGVRRAASLCEELGVARFKSYLAEILARSETMTRKAIQEIPPGEYSFVDYMDNDGVNLDEAIPIKATIRVDGSSFHADFTGSGDQVTGPFNTVSTHTCVNYVLRAVVAPDIHNDAGCYRPIMLTLPENSVTNPSPPAPVGARTATLKRITDALLGALVQAVPGRVPAASGGNTLVVSFAGYDPLLDRDYVTHELCVGGMGARPDRDGVDAIETDVTNTQTIPAEAFENEYPLRVIYDRLWMDSGGAGQYRGGLGREKMLEVTRGEMVVSYRGERHRFPPWGLFGGRPAPCSRAVIIRRDGRQEDIPSKLVFTLREGDRLMYQMSGGGGHGDPLARPPEDVAQDVERRKISAEAARTLYGVVLSADDFMIDQSGTRELRAAMSKERGPITWTYDRGEARS